MAVEVEEVTQEVEASKEVEPGANAEDALKDAVRDATERELAHLDEAHRDNEDEHHENRQHKGHDLHMWKSPGDRLTCTHRRFLPFVSCKCRYETHRNALQLGFLQFNVVQMNYALKTE